MSLVMVLPRRLRPKPLFVVWATLFVGGSSACVGDVDGGPFAPDAGPGLDLGPGPDLGAPDTGPAPDAGDPRRTVLPDDLPPLAVTATCAALAPGERALSVDPEGHLWLADTSTTFVALRVLDAWGERPERRYRTRYRSIAALVAESATTASVLADGEVWHFDDGIRLQVSAPFSPAPDATLCGSLRNLAFVATGAELYQRDADQWVRWEGIEGALGGPPRLVQRDGACFGGTDEVWLASGALETWALGPATITQTSSVAGASMPRARENQLLALESGELLAGPAPFSRFVAPSPIRALSAGGHYAWLVLGNALVRFDGERFEQAELQIARTEVTLHGFAAGGVWTTTDRSACAIAPPRMLRVAGLRSGARGTADRFALRARPSEPTADVFARVAGRELAPARVEDGWLVFAGPLELGWSEVRLSVSPGGLTRSLTVKREPTVSRSWQTDIRPIFEVHCAQSACHVADSTGGAPDLSMYGAWVERAMALERRVVDRQNMPPTASRSAEWGMDEVRIIEQWLEGGLKP